MRNAAGSVIEYLRSTGIAQRSAASWIELPGATSKQRRTVSVRLTKAIASDFDVGVHRAAQFALMSDATWQSVWNPQIDSFVVTAQELIGLNEFGYVKDAKTALGPGSMAATYVCTDRRRARDADLEAYHLAVALRETRGALGAAALVR